MIGLMFLSSTKIPKHKGKKYLKATKKKNKMLYIIANNSGLRRELKKIKKIKAKASKKCSNSRINSSSNESGYDSYLSINID